MCTPPPSVPGRWSFYENFRIARFAAFASTVSFRSILDTDRDRRYWDRHAVSPGAFELETRIRSLRCTIRVERLGLFPFSVACYVSIPAAGYFVLARSNDEVPFFPKAKSAFTRQGYVNRVQRLTQVRRLYFWCRVLSSFLSFFLSFFFLSGGRRRIHRGAPRMQSVFDRLTILFPLLRS